MEETVDDLNWLEGAIDEIIPARVDEIVHANGLVTLPRVVTHSGRWRFRRGTNRRIRKCLYPSPHFSYLLNDLQTRMERRYPHA
jgi:hypothetical protein